MSPGRSWSRSPTLPTGGPGGPARRRGRDGNRELPGRPGQFRPMAAAIVQEFRQLGERPEEINVEFGLKLTAEAGMAIAHTGGEANFKVNLIWRAQPTCDGARDGDRRLRDSGRDVVGAGFLFGPGEIPTLRPRGRRALATATPTFRRPEATVAVDFPLVAARSRCWPGGPLAAPSPGRRRRRRRTPAAEPASGRG